MKEADGVKHCLFNSSLIAQLSGHVSGTIFHSENVFSTTNVRRLLILGDKAWIKTIQQGFLCHAETSTGKAGRS